MKRILPVVLILALAAGGWLWWNQRAATGQDSLTLYGNIDVRQIALAFDGNGRITELGVEEGDEVAADQVIGRLDTRALELQAKAQAATVEAQRQNLLELRKGAREEEIAQARARGASAEASATLANLQRDRVARLMTSGSSAASQADMDRAEAEAGAANALVDQYDAALNLLLAGTREEELAATESRLRAAEAQLELLRFQISQGVLRAPSDAVVRSRLREPGDMVSTQSPVYALALRQPKWVRVYVREADLGRIRPGMEAQVLTDSFPDQSIIGQVGYISSVAEFTPKVVQTEELRTSLVYEVHVSVEDKDDRLRLGQPVTVRIPFGSVS
ncbi:MAG: HlyD family efflux transporter periplasmic adaptor subunit [Geminicoccaceae bacterium]|nr:HlyD family efflux transporter periplasmic adaptor subunit [Geminicoccaceae bacterium]